FTIQAGYWHVPDRPQHRKNHRWECGIFASLENPLLHRNPVRTCRSSGESIVEVDVETRVQFQVVLVHAYDVNVVIALKMNFAEVVFVKEVVGYDQPLVIISQSDCVRAGIHSQADDARLVRMLGVAHIKHADLPSLKRREELSIATLRHGQKLDHPAANWNLNVRNYILAVENDFCRAGLGVYQIYEAVK